MADDDNLFDRAAGAVVGVHAGDALGATVESASASTLLASSLTVTARSSAAAHSAGLPASRPTTPT